MFNIVLSMLSLRPNERRSATDIYNELLPHENQILDLEEFTVERNSYQNQPMRPFSQQVPPGAHSYFPPDNRQTQPAYQFQGQPQNFRR